MRQLSTFLSLRTLKYEMHMPEAITHINIKVCVGVDILCGMVYLIALVPGAQGVFVVIANARVPPTRVVHVEHTL
eukprot:scaffold12462_cov31-Prasinocladus_malaysianus.AAC.1